jgi:hypothetical protein
VFRLPPLWTLCVCAGKVCRCPGRRSGVDSDYRKAWEVLGLCVLETGRSTYGEQSETVNGTNTLGDILAEDNFPPGPSGFRGAPFGGLVLYKAAADAWFWSAVSLVVCADGSGQRIAPLFAVVESAAVATPLVLLSFGAMCVWVAMVGWGSEGRLSISGGSGNPANIVVVGIERAHL